MIYKGWTAKFENVFKRGRSVKFVNLYCGNQSGYDYVGCEYELCAECTKKIEEFLREVSDAERN